MELFNYLKKVFAVCLLVTMVLFGAAFSIDNSAAFAKPKTPEAAAYDVKGENSVDAYRNLQRATYSYRNEGFGEGSQTGKIGERLGLAERTGGKLQNRMDQRQDLASPREENAIENVKSNTKGAFQRAANKVQKKLNMD